MMDILALGYALSYQIAIDKIRIRRKWRPSTALISSGIHLKQETKKKLRIWKETVVA